MAFTTTAAGRPPAPLSRPPWGKRGRGQQALEAATTEKCTDNFCSCPLGCWLLLAKTRRERGELLGDLKAPEGTVLAAGPSRPLAGVGTPPGAGDLLLGGDGQSEGSGCRATLVCQRVHPCPAGAAGRLAGLRHLPVPSATASCPRRTSSALQNRHGEGRGCKM